MGPLKLLFSDGVVFEKNTHQYFYEGVEYLSVTSVIKKYTRGFPMHSIAEMVANKRGVSKESVEQEWIKNSISAAKRGAAVHEAIEAFIEQGIIEERLSGLLHSIKKEILTEAFFYGFNSFLTECRFVNKQYKYAGTFDFAAFNSYGECVLFDFKTSKIEAYEKPSFMLPPVNNLRATKDVIYSMQLYLYKRAIENFGFKVINMQIVYIDEGGIIERREVLPLEAEANLLLMDWVENSNNNSYLFRKLIK